MNTENKLPEDFKKKWIAALKSGEYEQGKKRLAWNNGDGTFSFCCLGVGACISGINAETLLGRSWPHQLSVDDRGKMPSLLCAGDFDTASVPNHLADMNDEGKSFSEIADWIEQNL